jgi:hypothetical protein
MPTFVRNDKAPKGAAFPYPSIRALINAATEWPNGLTYVGKNPDEIQPSGDWTEAVNAVLLDDSFWYIVQEKAFSQIPVSVPLDEAAAQRWFVWPHGGGSALFKGILYVAVHGNEDGSFPGSKFPPGDGQVWAVKPRGPMMPPEVLDSALIRGSGPLPWIDVHPRRPLLFWSHFDPGTREQLQVYSFSPWPEMEVKPLGAMTLFSETGAPLDLRRIQGGRVTPNNHLLLVCDTPPIGQGPPSASLPWWAILATGPASLLVGGALASTASTVGGSTVSGIHLFDLQTGRRRWHVPFNDVAYNTEPFHTFGISLSQQDEVQGIFVHHFGKDGYVHVNMVNKDLEARTDDFSLLNYDTPSALERWKL